MSRDTRRAYGHPCPATLYKKNTPTDSVGWGRQPLLQAGASPPVVRRLLPLRRRKLPPMSQGTGRPLGSQPLSQFLEIRPPPACLSSLCGKSTTLILKQPKESKESKGGRPGGSSGSTHSPRRREGLSSTRSPPPHCWGDRHRPRRLI